MRSNRRLWGWWLSVALCLLVLGIPGGNRAIREAADKQMLGETNHEHSLPRTVAPPASVTPGGHKNLQLGKDTGPPNGFHASDGANGGGAALRPRIEDLEALKLRDTATYYRERQRLTNAEEIAPEKQQSARQRITAKLLAALESKESPTNPPQ